jgi:hypothetical protein
MFYRIVIACCLISLSACATNSTLRGSELSEKIRSNFIVVNKIDKPIALAERTKAQAVAKFVVASAVSSLASSGNINSKPGDFQSFQKAANAQMEFGKLLNQHLTRTLPDSYKVSAGTGADLAIAKKLNDYYVDHAKKLALDEAAIGNAKELHVVVNAGLWELGYVSFLTSQDYGLNYQFQASLVENISGKDQVISSTTCLGKSEKEMPLETWKANDYEIVNQEANLIAEKCHQQFIGLLS